MTPHREEQRTAPVTTAIDAIALYGNRGHWFGLGDPQLPGYVPNWIECVDGFKLSVLAGAGAYGYPRVAICTCAYYKAGMVLGNREPLIMEPFRNYEQPHDYHGPYTHVEVMCKDPEPAAIWLEYGDGSGSDMWDGAALYTMVPVEIVRDLIVYHGGEVEKDDSFYRGTDADQ